MTEAEKAVETEPEAPVEDVAKSEEEMVETEEVVEKADEEEVIPTEKADDCEAMPVEKADELGAEGATEAPIEDVAESCSKSEPVESELPTFRDMMNARSGQGNPYDCSGDGEMLRGVRLGNIYKSEKGTIIVQNSSKPNVVSSVGIQTKPDINNLQKSMPMGFAPEGEINEADPLRKSLKSDWDTYIAYKQPETF